MSNWRKSWTGLHRRSGIAGRPRLRILLWATIAGLIFGAIELGEPIEDSLRISRNTLREHPASGEIVVAAVDDRSLNELGRWPWPRGYHARLIEGLQRLSARRILFDVSFAYKTEPGQDKEFEAALAASPSKVVLATPIVVDPATKRRSVMLPAEAFRKNAKLANINVQFNFLGWVWKLPYGNRVGADTYPSFAAELGGVQAAPGKTFLIDYSVDPRSIPTISAVDIIENKLPAGTLSGKDVIVGTTSPFLEDMFFTPGYGQWPGVYLHALGAETLRSGLPRRLSWLLPFLFGLAVSACCLRVAKLSFALVLSAAAIALVLAVPLLLDAYLISMDIVPTLFLMLVVTISLVWTSLRRSYRIRGTVNPVSGLLNLDALRQEKGDRSGVLIAARIHNYAGIASALPAGEEKLLVAQIAKRLTLGTPDQKLYQGDEGIFAWFAEQNSIAAIGEHLDALHGFFRNSMTVADRPVDLTISFGIDSENDRSLSNRLGSALVAADEAAASSVRWKAHDPSRLEDASWKLSLLGQLDRAIDSGDIWVAYQPKIDLASKTICGAEALARWTHPEKGPIEPLNFILAAEQSDRIEKLTLFILDQAIAAAASINAQGTLFNIAVNLSARLIDDPAFTSLVSALLAKHGLAPACLTLEVTETAAIGSGSASLETLRNLRDLGIGISIDDYGTGLSTLEYLKKIPATEIKIDQSFVAVVTKSHSDRLMVHSTIQLAHSLGKQVVAEGVEDQATLNTLTALGCDYAQGFFISRPVPLREFRALLPLEMGASLTRNG